MTRWSRSIWTGPLPTTMVLCAPLTRGGGVVAQAVAVGRVRAVDAGDGQGDEGVGAEREVRVAGVSLSTGCGAFSRAPAPRPTLSHPQGDALRSPQGGEGFHRGAQCLFDDALHVGIEVVASVVLRAQAGQCISTLGEVIGELEALPGQAARHAAAWRCATTPSGSRPGPPPPSYQRVAAQWRSRRSKRSAVPSPREAAECPTLPCRCILPGV